MGAERNALRILVVGPETKEHFKNRGVDWRIILKWSVK
jgi:hypothetical protein